MLFADSGCRTRATTLATYLCHSTLAHHSTPLGSLKGLNDIAGKLAAEWISLSERRL